MCSVKVKWCKYFGTEGVLYYHLGPINDSHIATCNDELRKKKGQDKKKRRSIPPNWEFF
jgi:hypothetical protein